jgi:hypothetical protein
MLVHQTDGAVGFDGAVVGFDRAEGDIGQRRFARAVFADERVNFTRKQIEIDAVDRDDAGIDLANAAQF